MPTLAAVAMLCLTLYLGNWQHDRAAEKRVLQIEYENRAKVSPIVLGDVISEPLAARYAHAIAQGEWLASGQIYIDNKFNGEAVGFHVITPLRIAGTDRYVLVNRGWVARGPNYPAPPSISVPTGAATVAGVLNIPSSRFLELGAAPTQGNVWQNLTVERYRLASKLDILPLVLSADATAQPLKAVSERPDAREEKHIEYMLTWYSLAVTIIVLWVALNLKIVRDQPRQLTPNKGSGQ
ncbi:MAG: SURF1 family protein [Usitatibacteraceae bacterium]